VQFVDAGVPITRSCGSSTPACRSPARAARRRWRADHQLAQFVDAAADHWFAQPEAAGAMVAHS